MLPRNDAYAIARAFAKLPPYKGLVPSPFAQAIIRSFDAYAANNPDPTSFTQALRLAIGNDIVIRVFAEDPSAPPPEDLHERRYITLTEDQLNELPAVEWLVKGELPQRSIAVLIGASNAGKSFLALDYCLRLAVNYRVIYVAAEGETGFNTRVKAWRKHFGITEGKANILYVLGEVDLFERANFETFLLDHSFFSPALVVFDTLAMTMGDADDNSARDMRKVLQSCKQIQREWGATSLLVHHLNKGGVVERGSGALRATCDTMIRVMPDDDLICMESVKTRDKDRFKPRYLKKVSIELGVDSDGEAVTSLVLLPAEKVIQTSSDSITTNQHKVLDCLAMKIYEFGATNGEIETQTDIPRGSLNRTLSKLLELGFIEQKAPREPYTISASGREALNRSHQLNQMNHLNHESSPVVHPEQQKMFKKGDSSDSSDSSDSKSHYAEGL
jgi:DNA-binding MarR family transcriptional regulator